MNNFVKIYGSIIRSTVWQTAPHVKLTWLTMLILADADGRVEASVPGLANTAGVTLAQCEEALDLFMRPDKYSRTKEHDGRRIREIPGGWLVLNHKLYRDTRTRTQQQAVERKQRQRAKARQRAETPATETSEPVERDERDMRDMRDMTHGSRTDPDPDPDLIQPDRGRAKDLTGSARAETSTRPRGARSHFAPDDFEPTETQRVRCQELGVDVSEALARFKAHEFERAYSDWPKRFDRWILDERKLGEIDAQRAARGGRARGAVLQPNHGKTGWESVEAQLAEADAQPPAEPAEPVARKVGGRR